MMNFSYLGRVSRLSASAVRRHYCTGPGKVDAFKVLFETNIDIVFITERSSSRGVSGRWKKF